MKTSDVITTIALLAGPTIAVLLTLYVQRREFIRNQRFQLFRTLLGFRSERLNPERIRSLGLIDVVFSNDATVRAKWKEYYETLNNPAYVNNPNQGYIYMTKENEMLAAMARSIGYGKTIGYEELARQYAPQAFADNAALQSAMQQEALRVLRSSENFGVPRVPAVESPAANVQNGPAAPKGASLGP